jgi:hypothetical protein
MFLAFHARLGFLTVGSGPPFIVWLRLPFFAFGFGRDLSPRSGSPFVNLGPGSKVIVDDAVIVPVWVRDASVKY